jgi:hypothetical protein
VVAHYLLIYLQAFIEHVLCLLLRVTDLWDCFKWQAHDSDYLYAFFWILIALALSVEIEKTYIWFTHY